VSGAAKSNVLMFLAAMCAVGTVWLAISAFGTGDLVYGLLAVLLAVATVAAFRAYRQVIRLLDEQERQV
jgi:hypothetical protein